jgi:hypothetical protein
MQEVPFGKFGFIKKQSWDWMTRHLPMVGSLFLIAFVGLFAFSHWVKGDSQVDFLAAEIAYRHWEGQKGEDLAKLEKIIKNHPELHAKYDASIAQKLLNTSESGLARGYGQATLKRIGDFSSYYTDFSEGSLLIAESHLTDALQRAKRLKEELQNDEVFWKKRSQFVRHGCILYAYNLLRIAMLEKAAGTPEGELAAWREFKENAGWLEAEPNVKTYDPEAYLLIQENFKSQEISLIDYIRHRENTLISKHP